MELAGEALARFVEGKHSVHNGAEPMDPNGLVHFFEGVSRPDNDSLQANVLHQDWRQVQGRLGAGENAN